MEMLEDVLLEEDIMTEVIPQKNRYRRNEELTKPDEYIKLRDELIRNRMERDRWVPEGYMTIEEGKTLTLSYLKSLR